MTDLGLKVLGNMAPPKPHGRRQLDFYKSGVWMIQQMLERVPIQGVVLEPCSGDGVIVRQLLTVAAVTRVWSNDIDPKRLHDAPESASHLCLDAGGPDLWRVAEQVIQPDWVVSNPPFNQAARIVPRALEQARLGVVMYLRISWIEPIPSGDGARAGFLAEHPPSKLIVLPRFSFSGDGKTDSVTGAWMVWWKGFGPLPGPPIEIVPAGGERPRLAL